MSAELLRQVRRVEAQADKGFDGSAAERGERRRRLRLEVLRQHLTSNVDFLRAAHLGGASGQQSVAAYAGFMDGFLTTLYRLAVDDAKREGLTPGPLVLVALGGYGRGELHPLSDLDLMLIYDGEMGPYVQRATQGLLYALWDLGLQVGHAVRSLPDCLAMARTDFPSRTSMQQARFLVGDRRLFNRFRKVLAENVYQKDFAQFLETTLTERDQRYRKFGGSPYMGEPNVKESAGGLRDIHTAMWLASTKFGTRTLQELADKRLITEREQKAADEALTFLWRVRNELHFLSGHKNDVLSRDIQPQIAKNFGYAGDELSLPVEKFMRDYYLHARVIHRVSRRLIARCRETLSRRATVQRRLRQEALADGLIVIDEQIHLAQPDGRAFREEPLRLLKVFWHRHQLGFELGIDVERAIEDSLDLIDDAFRASPEARDLFLGICRSWGRTAQTLREMHELGVLGRYLPEWGALTCLVQYDVYHKFTADQHSLLAVQHLEALAPGQSADAEGNAQVVSEVERPGVLMLGMLLHDIGKGKGHGHVAKGIPLIETLAARMGLAPEDTDTAVFLVAHHLTMSHIAQRRDIDDPKTIETLAEVCKTPERLRMLYLLTCADMRAVGPGVMTGWQAQILWDLYARTLARLTGGQRERPTRETVAERVAEAMGGEVVRTAVAAHLALLSDRYLATTSPQRIAAHLRLLDRLEGGVLATELFHHPDLGSSELVLATRDVPGLFSLIAGTLAAQGINILSAQIHTRADGIVIDTFQVNDPFGEAVTEEARWRRTLEALRLVLRGEASVEDLLARRRAVHAAGEGVAGPPKISVDNQLSDSRTVVEVKCPDRVGLLYVITRTLSGQGLDIASARIATEIDQAYDTFYVTDRRGRRLEDEAAMARVRESLEDALVKPL
ncbi:MAG TPA: [protein-PII] uridylyltransferase [Candidatus Deferrimicrobiaceae bacterium]|nr:[protein-PII] uridylyltransferase [Candidatus Deferrimicrobiaceae bacterium]